MTLSRVRKYLLSVMILGNTVACDDPPQRQPAPTSPAPMAAAPTCREKSESECKTDYKCVYENNSCIDKPVELACSDRKELIQCKQDTTCTWLQYSEKCIERADNSCQLRTHITDCQALASSSCVWSNNACTTFSSCSEVPVASCTSSPGCQRMLSGTQDTCVSKEEAKRLEDDARNKASAAQSKQMTEIVNAVVPVAISFINGIFKPKGTTETSDETTSPSSLSPRLSLGSQLPFLADITLSGGAPQEGTSGDTTKCSAATTPAQCDAKYPTCVFANKACALAKDLTLEQICQSTSETTSNGVEEGVALNALSETAKQRCRKYSRYCMFDADPATKCVPRR